MKILVASLTILLGLFAFSTQLRSTENIRPREDPNVYDILKMLGDSSSEHEVNPDMPYVSAIKGEEIFFKGYTAGPNGTDTKIQSKLFKCWSCHNTVIEEPDLTRYDPEARLDYAVKNKLPFLQGTTVYGIVNRNTYYNDDYYKKYGRKRADKAHRNLREAIQLCAIGCSQGRPLEDWEIESVLAYFWTLQYKLSDLQVTADEQQMLERAQRGGGDKAASIALLKSKYADYSPAHFLLPPTDRKAGYGLQGRPEKGRQVYEQSCLHCHKNGRFAYYYLDETPLSLKHLKHHFPKYDPYSSYQVICWGTEPLPGKKFYMPQYPEERMGAQLIEDLRAFLESPDKALH